MIQKVDCDVSVLYSNQNDFYINFFFFPPKYLHLFIFATIAFESGRIKKEAKITRQNRQKAKGLYIIRMTMWRTKGR